MKVNVNYIMGYEKGKEDAEIKFKEKIKMITDDIEKECGECRRCLVYSAIEKLRRLERGE